MAHRSRPVFYAGQAVRPVNYLLNINPHNNRVVSLLSAPPPRPLTLTGLFLLYLVQNHLATSTGADHRGVFITSRLEQERWLTGAWRLFRQAMALMRPDEPPSHPLVLASLLARCLRLLQTRTRGRYSPRVCIICGGEAHFAQPRLEALYGLFQVEVGTRNGNTVGAMFDAVSILPPVRNFDSPRLCSADQDEFTRLLYRAMMPI